jgi:pre-mRNA-splicing factor SYF1
VEHAKKVETGDEVGIDVERIIRSGIDRFADQRGKLWSGLATYWITRGSFERARDVFEEGITTVMTVRDFTLIPAKKETSSSFKLLGKETSELAY